MPFLTVCTPPFVHAMLGDFHGWRGWNVNDLAAASETDPSQTQVAIGAGDNPMFHDLGGHGASTCMVVVGLALFSRLALLLLRLLLIRLDEGRRGRFLFFYFPGPRLRLLQLLFCSSQGVPPSP